MQAEDKAVLVGPPEDLKGQYFLVNTVNCSALPQPRSIGISECFPSQSCPFCLPHHHYHLLPQLLGASHYLGFQCT